MQNVTMQPNLEALQAQQGMPQGADISAFANQNVNLEATPQADTLELSPQIDTSEASTPAQPAKKSKKGLLLGLGAVAIAVAAAIGIKKGKIHFPFGKGGAE